MVASAQRPDALHQPAFDLQACVCFLSPSRRGCFGLLYIIFYLTVPHPGTFSKVSFDALWDESKTFCRCDG